MLSVNYVSLKLGQKKCDENPLQMDLQIVINFSTLLAANQFTFAMSIRENTKPSSANDFQ